MSNYTNVYLKCNLKDIMETNTTSANKLAKDINERRSTINDLINNNDMDRRQIPARLIAKLCIYFEVTPSDLFEVHKK